VKIYNRKDFLALPVGTVFFDYTPHVGEGLSVKTSGPSAWLFTPDFCRQDIDALGIESHDSNELMDKMTDMFENGTERPMVWDSSGRDGMFDEDAHFAVLDDADIKRLVEVLTGTWRR